MKVLHLTDIHGNKKDISMMSKWLETADLVILSGDITHFGRRDDSEEILNEIEKYNKNILSVTGNCDYPDVQTLLETRGYFLDNTIKEINHLIFAGLSGSLPCPESTPNEFSEEQYKAMIDDLKNRLRPDYPMILISHQPPHKTKNDKIKLGMHVGSKVIRNFIENMQPLACFTGHIHEGKAVDLIGNTKIINPGPFKNGKFAWTTIDNNEIHVEFKKV